jgi:hypothetical protein
MSNNTLFIIMGLPCSSSRPPGRLGVGSGLRLTAHSLARYYGVVEPMVGKSLVAFDSCIVERGVFVAAEREHRLVHLLGVEHF